MRTLRQIISAGEVGLLRPWLDDSGKSWVMIKGERRLFDPADSCWVLKDGTEVSIKEAVLTKDEWNALDLAAMKSFNNRVRLVKLLLNGEGLHRRVDCSSPTTADGIPLLLTHCDFWLSHKCLTESHSSKAELSTTMCEAAARRVAEALEKTAIGVPTGVEGVEPQDVGLFGVFNHPNRLRVGFDLVAERERLSDPSVLKGLLTAMTNKAASAGRQGPSAVIHSHDLDQFFDNDSDEPEKRRTAREKACLELAEQVLAVDHCKESKLGLIQLTQDSVQLLIGQKPIIVQWPTEKCEERVEFKLLACMVPNFKLNERGEARIMTSD